MSKEIKKFIVNFYYEESGSCVVEATNEKEAETIMGDRLADDGLEGYNYKCSGREFSPTMCKEIVDKTANKVDADIKYEVETEPDTNAFDVEISLFDVNDDPTTPYYQTIVLVVAGTEKEALAKAKEMAYKMPEAAGFNVSAECEIA